MHDQRFRVVIAALAVLAVFALRQLLDATGFDLGGALFQLAVVLLSIFLVVLVVRYVLLLWLGYLHHIEGHAGVEEGVTPHVTVIVPVFNVEAVIVPALRALLELRYPWFDIVVVDDGSRDRTYEMAQRMAGRYGNTNLRVVTKRNGGKASALNTGVAIAQSPFVLCMDGDSRLSPDTLRFAMRHFANPRVAAVAGNVKVVNRINLWTRLQALEYIEGLNMPRRAQGFVRAVNIVPGPIGVFRRDVLLRVGGYDTDTYAEDADLTLKILTDGWQIVYEDRAIAYTEAPEGLLDIIKQRYRWTRGILQAIGKRRDWLTSPKGGIAVWISLLSLFFEAIIWPAVNVLGNLFFATAALAGAVPSGVFYWWALLTLLDVAAALHSVAMEEESLALVPYAVIYRFFFIATIDVAKLFATVEQIFRVPMTWGKLERAGRL
jgi:cellulose synthase/poly-beta-1,6-N-acetylglucosamine synthase-like glycosyltransferase